MKAVVQYNHSLRIIQDYAVREPLSRFLTQYFKENRQIGSKDRRFLRSLVYQYFRLGHSQNQMETGQGLVVAHFLCQQTTTPFLEHWFPQFSQIPTEKVTKPKAEKLELLRDKGFPIQEDGIFPFRFLLSNELDAQQFIYALLEQPPVYIRLLYSKHGAELIKELASLNWSFQEIEPCTFALSQNAPINQLNAYKTGQVTIMDRSVQKLADHLPALAEEQWWDCCAGAGGKSLLLKSLNPEARLWVSDNRDSMLKNHQKRMAQHGYQMAGYATVDLEKDLPSEIPEFDGILLDAPCSGSGTWLRTPEGLQQYGKKDIEAFQARQIKMASNVLNQLKPGGKLVYITCSAFAMENEEVVENLEKQGLKIKQQAYIKGYQRQAETLFLAVLEKSSK